MRSGHAHRAYSRRAGQQVRLSAGLHGRCRGRQRRILPEQLRNEAVDADSHLRHHQRLWQRPSLPAVRGLRQLLLRAIPIPGHGPRRLRHGHWHHRNGARHQCAAGVHGLAEHADDLVRHRAKWRRPGRLTSTERAADCFCWHGSLSSCISRRVPDPPAPAISQTTGTAAPATSAEAVQPPDQGTMDQLAEQYVRRTRLDSEEPGNAGGVGGQLATIPEAMPALPESPLAQRQLSRPFPKKRLDSDRRMFSSTISGFDVSSMGNLSDPDALLKSLPGLFARRRAVRKSKAAKVARARQFDIAQIRAGVTAANLADLRRPFYRRDIFYSGSVMNLTSARVRRSQQSLAPSQLFLSMTRIPGEAPPMQSPTGDLSPPVNLLTPPKCLRCLPKPIVDAFLMMVDLGLMKDLGFVIIWIANLIVMLAFYVPLFFVSSFAREIDVSEEQARYLNSAFGAANTVCRIAIGGLASNPRVSALLLNNLSLLLSGVFCILLNFCTGFWSLLTVYTILGICLAPVVTLTSEVLCKLVGLDNLTNAFGLVTLARGISVCIGSPITASLYNERTKYSLPFSFGGCLFIVGSVIFSILLLPRFRQKEEDNQQKVEDMIKSAHNLNASLVLVDGSQVVASSNLDLHALASPHRKLTLSHQNSTMEDAIPEEAMNDYYEETV
ncbi:hypothetical protein BOX15_Mlig016045g3 [Macrostomum lignano]|uniref:MFS domain-containing protein n=1 Tax=Macrostomum lignano TaxID=282301 RepID=A0A267E440_9PLAT|nr:hypothetical protein BOX15_Mlig016045g3 [Macrostomum lignano]